MEDGSLAELRRSKGKRVSIIRKGSPWIDAPPL